MLTNRWNRPGQFFAHACRTAFGRSARASARAANWGVNRAGRLEHDLAGRETPVGAQDALERVRVRGRARNQRRQEPAAGDLALTGFREPIEQLVEALVDGDRPQDVGLDGRAQLDPGRARDDLTITHAGGPGPYDDHMISGATTMPLPGDSRKVDGPLRLLTLNISGPSVARAERIASFLGKVDADVAVLTETRDNEGTRTLLEWCRSHGYLVTGDLPPSNRERGVAVVRRVGPDRLPLAAEVDLPHRLVIDEIGDEPSLRLVAAYVPSRDASQHKIDRKRTFLDQMATALRRFVQGERLVFMGDLNIVGRTHVPRYSAFKSWEYEALDKIAALGLSDVFAKMNPGVQVYSWVGRTGSGYRYDYAFVSPDLMDMVETCEYLHYPRELGITDHAAVLLTLKMPEKRSPVMPTVNRRPPRRAS